MPIITRDLALHIEQSKGDHIESWIRGMQHYHGNLFDCHILQIKNVRVFASRHLQEIGLFNVVIGLGPDDEALLPEIARFYQDHHIENYRLEINPYQANAGFCAALAVHDFALSSFQTYLYGLPVLHSPGIISPSITVRNVTSAELDLFADLHIEGFQEALSSVSEQTRRLYRESTKVLYGIPEWHLSLLLIKNVPVGIGMLFVKDDLALLAGGAILPQNRKQGAHTVSLRHRMILAAQTHCTLISAQTSVGSQSQQNMERLGMHVAYTGTAWTHRQRV